MPRSVRSLAALACVLAVAGCDSGGTSSSRAAVADVRPATSAPSCTPAPLEQRAAGVLLVGLPGVHRSDEPLATEATSLGVAGVFVNHDNVVDRAQVAALVQGLRAAAPGLLVSSDEESGRVSNLRSVIGAGPSPRRLGAQSPAAVHTYAAGLGSRLATLGVDLDLGPSLDLDAGPSGGIIGDRSFSAVPSTAAAAGLAFAQGLTDAGVTPVVKHFPGQGRSTADTHTTSGTVTATVDALRPTDLAPFQRAVDDGAPAVMLNHLSYTALDADLPASLSPKAYALLRSMGFTGVAMTDSVGMAAVNTRWGFPQAAVMAVSAGADLVLTTDGGHAREMRDALVAAVRSGQLPEERLDEAAARVAALAGRDPVALTCTTATSPTLTSATAGSGATGTASASATTSSTPTRATTSPSPRTTATRRP